MNIFRRFHRGLDKSSEGPPRAVHKGSARGKVAQATVEMGGKLRRGLLASLAVAGVFAACLTLTAMYVEFELTYAKLVSAEVRNTTLDILLLVYLSGWLPSFVLGRFPIRNIVAYLFAGALSGLLAVYAFLLDFGWTFTLFGGSRPAPPISRLLLKTFSDLPGLATEAPHDVRWIELVAALIGLAFGGLYWLLFVRRLRR